MNMIRRKVSVVIYKISQSLKEKHIMRYTLHLQFYDGYIFIQQEKSLVPKVPKDKLCDKRYMLLLFYGLTSQTTAMDMIFVERSLL